MGTFGLVFFSLYLPAMVALDVAMLVSLLRPGDERRQMIVWRAGTWTLVGVTGGLVFGIAEAIVLAQDMRVNPLAVLTGAATLYFLCLLFYKRKYGD